MVIVVTVAFLVAVPIHRVTSRAVALPVALSAWSVGGYSTLPALSSAGRSPPPLHAVRIMAGGLQQSWMFKCTSDRARRIVGAQVRRGNLPLSWDNKQIAYRRQPPAPTPTETS